MINKMENYESEREERFQNSVRTSIRLIQTAEELSEVYSAVRMVIDLPYVESKHEMRQHLATLAASFLTEGFGDEMLSNKTTFIVELADKIAELPDDEFV